MYLFYPYIQYTDVNSILSSAFYTSGNDGEADSDEETELDGDVLEDGLVLALGEADKLEEALGDLDFEAEELGETDELTDEDGLTLDDGLLETETLEDGLFELEGLTLEEGERL